MKYEDHVRLFMELHPDADRSVVERVNREIDQFAHFPNMVTLQRHRKFLHHAEGIEYFGIVYGDTGRRAAELHVQQDCLHVPDMADYVLGTVDDYGLKSSLRRTK